MYEQVRDAVSSERLASYLEACAGELEPALALYRWNQDIAGGLLRPLCDLEITFRNALQQHLEVISHPEPWWLSAALRDDARVCAETDRAHRSLVFAGKRVTSGGMVSEMSFGFWVALISSRFDMTLWRRGLYRAFARYRGPRRPLHLEFKRMLGLRNRIGHHEPIHHRHLAADRRTIHRLLGYLSPDMQRWGEHGDRFPEILSCRPPARGPRGAR